MSSVEVAPVELVESRILVIRKQKVLLDKDLAELYQVTTGNLNKAVRRNRERFPDDFMFQLSPDELDTLIFQTGRSKATRGGRRFSPYAFTEQGIAMLSGVLTSKRAVEVNVAIMRTFVRLRQLLSTHEELARRLDQLEWRQSEQDGRVQYVFETIQRLIDTPEPGALPVEPKRSIGFPTSQVAVTLPCSLIPNRRNRINLRSFHRRNQRSRCRHAQHYQRRQSEHNRIFSRNPIQEIRNHSRRKNRTANSSQHPAAAIAPFSAQTIEITFRGIAPRASRIPISPVRRSVE